VARLALATQRALDNEESRRRIGRLPDTSTVRCAEALQWITLEGARMLKMADRIGSLTPGKQADLVVLSADDLNMWPVHDPVVSVITQASVANVDSVMIAGQWKKRARKLTYPLLNEKKLALQESGRRILAEMGQATNQGV
jgi:cytosine/adenosine deaminase-related metal-dependent hydrolase